MVRWIGKSMKSGLVRGEKGWKNGKWKNERLEDMGGLTDD